MHVFRTDFATDDKALPRTAARSRNILLLYALFTLLCTIAYMSCGMEVFDAIAHAMATISTGGFSTYDQSLLYFRDKPQFNALGIEFFAVVFMLIGALPFVLYLSAIKSGYKVILKDQQVKALGYVIAFSVAILFFALVKNHGISHFIAFREAIFNSVSLITGTGFSTTDYDGWSPFNTSILMFLMILGGCAGSTTGGIKIFRFQILYVVILGQIQKLIYPNAVYIPHFNKKPIARDIPISVMGFFFVFAICFALLALGLAMTGLDFTTAFSGSLAAIANVGPGLGEIIGPFGSYKPISDSAKWMLSVGMIIGRLELFMVLVMFSPYYWRS